MVQFDTKKLTDKWAQIISRKFKWLKTYEKHITLLIIKIKNKIIHFQLSGVSSSNVQRVQVSSARCRETIAILQLLEGARVDTTFLENQLAIL